MKTPHPLTIQNPIPSPEEWLARQRDKTRNQGLLARALKAFQRTITKDDRGKYFFISAYPDAKGRVGQRLPPTARQKAFAVYVPQGWPNTKQAAIPYREPKIKRDKEGKTWRLKSRVDTAVPREPIRVDLTRGSGQRGRKVKAAWDAVLARIPIGRRPQFDRLGRPVVDKEGRMVDTSGKPIKGDGTVDFAPAKAGWNYYQEMAAPLANELAKIAADQKSLREFQVSGVIQVEGMDKPITVSAVHKMSDAQQATPAFFKQFVNVSIYAQVAEQMQNNGLVSQGSAAYVKRLPMNRGKPRSKWKVKRQYSNRTEKWEKAHLTEAKITGASFKIFKLGIRSAKAPHGQVRD